MTDQARPLVSLKSAELAAEIDSQGAQLYSLKDGAARDLLWDGDPAVWAGRAPLLFPIIGVLAGGSYRIGSNVYHLPRHGFARGKLFAVESTNPTSAVFKLSADESTLQVYPFRFELTVRFEIIGPTLSVDTLVRNQGDEEMPASFGYHPAFRWPLPFGQPRAAHFIQFEADEPAPYRRIDSAGLLKPERFDTPIVRRRLPLTDALFQEDVLIFDQIKSRSVVYGADQGPRLRVNYPDSPYLGLWTKPGAPFICIEPWHGITDPVGFSGQFADKPGMANLRAGEALHSQMTVTLLAV
ncbi:MAG TPA: aldose 1-epimerase family protein [Steroidobacteraceae bacterium]|jgi:galactose mutarotase-like enzyme